MKILNNYTVNLAIFFVLFTTSCLKDDYRSFSDEEVELKNYIKEKGIEVLPEWSGLYFIEEQEGTGELANLYDTVVIEFKMTRLDGFVLASSEENGEAATIVVGDNNQLPGLKQSLTFMRVGGKATSIVPSTLAFRDISYEDLEAYSTIIYEIEMLEIIRGIEVEPFNVDTIEKNTTISGLEYYVVQPDTSGDVINAGDYLKLNYTGYLANGKIFDSSVKREQPVSFQIGVGRLIKGWEEGVVLMRVGEKFRFIIPPELGYGDAGSIPFISPAASLIFDIEVLEKL